MQIAWYPQTPEGYLPACLPKVNKIPILPDPHPYSVLVNTGIVQPLYRRRLYWNLLLDHFHRKDLAEKVHREILTM